MEVSYAGVLVILSREAILVTPDARPTQTQPEPTRPSEPNTP